MKKFKLIATSVLASTLVLGGCNKADDGDKHTHSFSTEWNYDKDNHWHACECGEVSAKAEHFDPDKDHICNVCEQTISTCVDIDHDYLCDYCGGQMPRVVRVMITGSEDQIDVGATLQLGVNVTTVGGAKKDVFWSSSNDSIATVSDSGLVTGVKAGTVTIRATSQYADIYGETTIEVIIPNWDDREANLIEEHLSMEIPYYGRGWERLSYDNEMDCLYSFSEEEINLTELAYAYEDAGFEVSYDGYEGIYDFYQFVKDINDTSRVVVILINDPYGLVGFGCCFFEAMKEVAVAEWPTLEIAEYTPKYFDFEEESVPELAADAYYINAGEESIIIEPVNATEDADAYISKLDGAGWEIDDSSDTVEYYGGVLCVSPLETISVVVYDDAGYYAIDIVGVLPTLEEFPSTYLDAFTKDVVGSFYKVPALEGGEEYYYYETVEYVDEDSTETIDVAEVYVDGNATLAMFKGYYATLLAEGFESVSYQEADDNYYESFMVFKGKIMIYGYLDDDDEENLEIVLEIAGDAEAEEVPFDVLPSSIDFCVSEIETLVPTAVEGYTGTFTYGSSNEEVATVVEGVVTGVAAGEAIITVTFTDEGGDTYTKQVPVTVHAVAESVSLSAPEELVSGKSAKLSYALLPNGSKVIGDPDAVYEITSGSEYATLTGDVLAANADVTEEQTVTVKVTVGALTATADVKITPKKDPITETISKFTSTTFTSSIGVKFEAIQGTSGLSAPQISSGQYRCYMGNQMTITAPEGHVLTCVKFTINNGGKTVCTVTANVGSFNKSTNTWTGEAEQVVLSFGTVSGSQFRIDSIYVELDGEGGEEGGGGDVPVISDTILNAAKTFFTSFMGEEPASIGDYDDEESEADMYVCKNGDLEFAGFYSFEFLDDTYTCADLYDELVDSLPSGATKYSGYEGEIDEEWGFYDVWYQSNGLIYAVYVCDYDGEGWAAEYGVDVFEVEDKEAYIEYAYSQYEE